MEQRTAIIIDTVKDYPVLYDTSHSDYKNNRMKYEIWNHIAEFIEEKDGNVVKSKWKNLKDAYTKYLRAKNSRTGKIAKTVERYRTWPWANQMSFLRPYITFSSTDSEEQIDTENVDATVEESSTPPQAPQSSAQPQSTRPRYEEPSTSSQNLLPEHPLQQFPRQITPDQNESQDRLYSFYNRTDIMEHDETDLIFLGYSRIIKKMSKRRQAIVKYQIANIVMDAELQHAEETSEIDVKEERTEEYYDQYAGGAGIDG